MALFDWLKILWSLSDEDKKNLEVFCQERFLESWEILFREWEDANAMYILKNGSVSIYKDDLWEKKELWMVSAEEILWEMALFWGWWKRMATAEALETTELITILSFSLKELTIKHPELMSKIQEVIEERNMSNKTK